MNLKLMNTEPKIEKPFDRNLPYRMRNGWQAKIVADDLSGDYPLLITYTDGQGKKCVTTFCLDGRYRDRDTAIDLVNIPPEPERIKWKRLVKIFTGHVADDCYVSPETLARIWVDFDIPIGSGLNGSPVPVFKEVKEDVEIMKAIKQVLEVADYSTPVLFNAILNLRRAAKLE